MRVLHPIQRRAMTLLEVIVAITLIVMLMGSLTTFFWQVVRARDEATMAADRMQIARQVLDRISAELRSCVGLTEIGFPIEQRLVEEEYLEEGTEIERPDDQTVVVEEDEETETATEGQAITPSQILQQMAENQTQNRRVPLLVGNRRNISFLTARLPDRSQYRFIGVDEQPPPARHDLTQISYWLWTDMQNTDEAGNPLIGGIMRTEKQTLNQYLVEYDDPLDIRNDLWSPELGYIEFRYFDGVEWDTKWDGTKINTLPQLIQVTVGFEPCTEEELNDRDLDDYPLLDYPYGDDKQHPDRYSVIVRMPAADKLFSSRVNRQINQGFTEQLLGSEEGF